MSKFGFYDYDDVVVNADGVIYKESLTSLPSANATEVGAGSGTFSSAGYTGVVTSGLAINGITGGPTDQTDLAVEGTIQFMISNEAFDKLLGPASTSNFIVFAGGTNLLLNKNAGTKAVKLICSTTLDGKYTGNDQIYEGSGNSRELVDGLVECTITWDQTGVLIYVDKYPVFKVSWIDSSKRPTFTTINLNGSGTGGGEFTFKNLLISTKKTVIKPGTLKTNIIHIYGDSYPTLSNYAEINASGQQSTFHYSPSAVVGSEAYTEDGLNAPQFQSGIDNEGGMIPVCHRQLTKAGLFTSRIIFWGESGSGYEDAGGATGDDVPTRIDIALDGPYPKPNIAIMVAGYNDAASGGITGGYQAAIQGAVDALETANSNIKIIITTLPYNTNAAYLSGEADPLAQCQAVNTVIQAIADANDSVTLVDMYTIFGGATNDGTTNMKNDFIHPDIDGRVTYGQKIAEAIIGLSL